MNKTAAISFRIEPDVKEKLQALAETDRRKLSDLVAMVLEDYVKSRALGNERTNGAQTTSGPRFVMPSRKSAFPNL